MFSFLFSPLLSLQQYLSSISQSATNRMPSYNLRQGAGGRRRYEIFQRSTGSQRINATTDSTTTCPQFNKYGHSKERWRSLPEDIAVWTATPQNSKLKWKTSGFTATEFPRLSSRKTISNKNWKEKMMRSMSFRRRSSSTKASSRARIRLASRCLTPQSKQT